MSALEVQCSAKFDGMLEIRLGIPPTCGLQQQRAKGGKVRGFTTSCWSPLQAPSSDKPINLAIL